MAADRCLPQTQKPLLLALLLHKKIGGKIYVVIGTGQYLNSDGTTDATQNYAYGLIDDPNNTTTISNSALLEQTIKSRAATYNTEPPRTLWHVSKNPFIEGTHRGWRLNLCRDKLLQPIASFVLKLWRNL